MLIFAEVTPKTLAALYPEKVAFPSSIILKGLLKIMFPFVVIINWMTNGILRLFGISAAQIDEHSMSKEELKTVLMSQAHLFLLVIKVLHDILAPK